MVAYKLVFPLLNKNIRTFPGPPCLLKDGAYIRTITDEVYGAFHRDAYSVYDFVENGRTKCIYVDYKQDGDYNKSQNVEYAIGQARKLRTLLNLLGDEDAIVFGPVAILREARRLSIVEIVQTEATTEVDASKHRKYRFKPYVTRETIAEAFGIVDNVCDNYARVHVTLDRYNSSLTRHSWQDKIIDTTIGLESLIPGKTELRFKFALYLSHIVEGIPKDRLQAFALLRDLYDARSSLVHGSADRSDSKKIGKVQDNWHQLSRYALTAINYYLFYLHYQDKPDWDTHLRNLVFDIDLRIVD